MSFSFGETVTVRRTVVSGQNDSGNDIYTHLDASYVGWAVYPRESVERVQGQDLTITGIVVAINEQIAVAGIDTVVVNTGPYADTYAVDGLPGSYVSPFTGNPVTVLNLTKAAG